VEVTIPISLTDSTDNDIRNAVTTALSTQLGISLPGDYQQVMYVIEDCYGDDCGWAAYAYVNSWNSVYAGLSYSYRRVYLTLVSARVGVQFCVD